MVKKTKSKISKKLSNAFIIYSLLGMSFYIAITAITRFVRDFQPSSLGELYQILAYLSLVLILPAAVISVAIFARIMSDKSSWLNIILVSLMPAVLVWIVSAIIFALLNIDPLTVYGIELI